VVKKIHILLVEDNPADADLIRESLRSSRYEIELTVAVNGSEALDCIHKRGKFAGAPTPKLILLDLNLPGIDGRGVLADVKQDAALRKMPVLMLTSSTAEQDITQTYDLGANCYVVKPLDFKSFQAIVQALEDFWFDVVTLPEPASV
jgi:two-component system, chemotaxis family, response regulator Rcp1